MNFGIVVFPGTTGQYDIKYAVENNFEVSCIEIWHTTTELPKTDAIIIPGGCSFADYLRPGAIAALSPVINAIKHYAHKGGVVIGIGNGFQILCEAGMLPGTLLINNKTDFMSKDIFFKTNATNSSLTLMAQKEQTLKLPIAHKYGRYFASNDELTSLHQDDLILFRYCDENNRISIYANPDGSTDNIAGICNFGRNVCGIMPHFERACDEEIGNTDGKVLFESIIDWIGHHHHN